MNNSLPDETTAQLPVTFLWLLQTIEHECQLILQEQPEKIHATGPGRAI